jgi:hypothetical protein
MAKGTRAESPLYRLKCMNSDLGRTAGTRHYSLFEALDITGFETGVGGK